MEHIRSEKHRWWVGAGSGREVTAGLLAFLQSTFINRPALGIFPPENFVEKLRESLLSVSLWGQLATVRTHLCPSPRWPAALVSRRLEQQGRKGLRSIMIKDGMFLLQSCSSCCFFHEESF